MNRESFAVNDLEARRSGIGGSDASAIMDDNNYKSKYELAREKIGLDDPAPVSNMEYVQWGTWMEEWYLRIFKVKKPRDTFFFRNNNWMYCHIDGISTKLRTLYEIKAPVFNSPKYTVDNWRDLPKHYLWQCVHNGLVYEHSGKRRNRKLEQVELVIVTPPCPVSYVINWKHMKEEMADHYFETARKFWIDCINDVLPPPETKRDMKLAYPSVNVAEYPEASDEEFEEVKSLQKLKTGKKNIEVCIEGSSNRLRGAIKDFNGLSRNGKIIVSNKDTKAGNRVLKTYDIKDINVF